MFLCFEGSIQDDQFFSRIHDSPPLVLGAFSAVVQGCPPRESEYMFPETPFSPLCLELHLLSGLGCLANDMLYP